MPSVTVICQGKKVQLGDTDYLAAGGEAAVYVKGGLAYRIQHDPATLPPLRKLEELMAANVPKAILPLSMLTNAAGMPVGFTMQFRDKAEPVARLFNRVFRTQNGIRHPTIAELAEDLRVTMATTHSQGCTIVDFNAFNILVPQGKWNEGYIIDTASWATPSFPPTAIMEDIRDPLVHGNKFNSMSDWYSWGIIAFQLYTGLHPFKGKHPKYQIKDWKLRMEHNASVFDSGVVLPPTTEPFDLIPDRHLQWFKQVFSEGKRTEPPSLSGVTYAVVAPSVKVAINNRGRFTVTELCTMPDNIVDVHQIGSTLFLVGNSCVWDEKGTVRYRAVKPGARLFMTVTDDQTEPVVIEFCNAKATFRIMRTGEEIGNQDSVRGVFVRNNRVYIHHDRCLSVNSVGRYGAKWQLKTAETDQLSQLASRTMDGCVVQDLFRTLWVVVPTVSGHSMTCKIAEVGNRNEAVVAARFDGRVLVLLTKHRQTSAYARHVVVFKDDDLSGYSHRVEENVDLAEPNFACVPNGPVVLSAGDDVEVFGPGNGNVTRVPDAPFDSNMPLRFAGGVMFIDGKTVYRVKLN